MKKQLSRLSGFTLIELLVVIAIIGILASVVLASLNSARAKARDARRMSDMKQVATALELYRDSYGAYPAGTDIRESSCYTGGNFSTTPGTWSTALTALVTAGYLPSVPVDPKNNGIAAFGGGSSQSCYSYYTGTSMTDVYSSCKDVQTGTLVYPGSYEYILYLSLENPPTKRYAMNWSGTPTPPSNTCILGPAK